MTSAIERAVAAVGPERLLASLSVQEQQALAYQWRLWAGTLSALAGLWEALQNTRGC